MSQSHICVMHHLQALPQRHSNGMLSQLMELRGTRSALQISPWAYLGPLMTCFHRSMFNLFFDSGAVDLLVIPSTAKADMSISAIGVLLPNIVPLTDV